MTDRSTLPIPDYDHLPLGSLESRIRTLDEPGLEALLVHESKHGDRLPVTNVLRQRLEAVRAGAKPTGGDGGAGEMPEAHRRADHEPKASPATEGPPQNPPSQGVPTNPTQPRR